MILAQIVHGLDGLKIQYEIRQKVFIEEQGVDPSLERDEYDRDCFHVIVYEDDKPVGTGRVIEIDHVYTIGRIAVLKEYRGKQYGDLIVRKLLDHCFIQGITRVEVHAQVQVLDFYSGIGFIPFGDTYEEANILHRSMYITPESFTRKCSH